MQIAGSSYDVIVCGGGTAGVSAAIASSRTGAKTLLVERTGMLGGQMTLSGPPGFGYAQLFNARGEQVVGGIIQETHKRLLTQGHALPHIKPAFKATSEYTFSYVDPDWWQFLIFDMMIETGVELLLHALVVDVLKERNKVKGIIIESPSGRETIIGKVVVDCTGEGDVSAKAGVPYEIMPKDKLRPHTLSFTADGVNWEKVLKYIDENPDEFDHQQLIQHDVNIIKKPNGDSSINAKDVTEVGEIMGFFSLRDKALEKKEWHGCSGVGFFMMPREGGVLQAHFQQSSQVGNIDPTNVRDITYCEVECRKQIQSTWNFFKKYIPGFENAYISRVCTELRSRESRRIIGDYVLTIEDIRTCRKFDDVIGKSSFKAGGHHGATLKTLEYGAQRVWPKDGGSYDIPYRCLVPRDIENLLVGGKIVSTTREAHLRYLQQTMVTGQAAGVAAGLCAQKDITPRELENDTSELQELLVMQGAILYGTH